jgi:hypothetical protein
MISRLRRALSGSAPTWTTLAVAVGLTLLLTLGAWYVVSVPGAPQTPSRGAWVDQAHTSLDEVASDVATAQLLLRLVDEDKMLSKYQQIVVLDAENDADKVAGHLSGEQVEPIDDKTYDDVTTVLSDAGDLLSSTRTAIVRRDSAQYAGLARALAHMQDRITKAGAEVPS